MGAIGPSPHRHLIIRGGCRRSEKPSQDAHLRRLEIFFAITQLGFIGWIRRAYRQSVVSTGSGFGNPSYRNSRRNPTRQEERRGIGASPNTIYQYQRISVVLLSACFDFPPTWMEYKLGISVREFTPFKNQI